MGAYIRLQSSYFTRRDRNPSRSVVILGSPKPQEFIESRVPNPQYRSVFGLRGIDLVDPVENAPLEVLHAIEPDRAQEIRGLCAAAAHLALRHDVLVLRQFGIT